MTERTPPINKGPSTIQPVNNRDKRELIDSPESTPRPDNMIPKTTQLAPAYFRIRFSGRQGLRQHDLFPSDGFLESPKHPFHSDGSRLGGPLQCSLGGRGSRPGGI